MEYPEWLIEKVSDLDLKGKTVVLGIFEEMITPPDGTQGVRVRTSQDVPLAFGPLETVLEPPEEGDLVALVMVNHKYRLVTKVGLDYDDASRPLLLLLRAIGERHPLSQEERDWYLEYQMLIHQQILSLLMNYQADQRKFDDLLKVNGG